jgi:toxin FitB
MTQPDKYLIDTNVISELRKNNKANPGVLQFFQHAVVQAAPLYLSVITIGELQRGVDLIRHRGDKPQAALLETWLQTILNNYADHILDFTVVEVQVWGRLRVPHPHNALDK